jgi:uncharacterized membrane protein
MTFAVRFVLALLIAVGVMAAVGRALFPGDLVFRVEPTRTRLMEAAGIHDPLAAQRWAELARFDGRLGAHPVITHLHVVPGALFLLLAPLQFSSRIRAGHPAFHRWSGRVLVAIALTTVVAGLFFGLLMPYGGPGEAVVIALVACLLFFAVTRAVVAVRRGQVALHREWMIRAFAVMIAISTVRVFGLVLDFLFTPAAIPPADGFVVSLWMGWAVTLAVAEMWIRSTRPHGGGLAAAPNAA